MGSESRSRLGGLHPATQEQMRHEVAPATVNIAPAVVLVADLREADDPNDRCAEIINAVRQASRRGISVAELSPDSKSDLLHRYRVRTVPTVLTVLFLDAAGNEIGRYEGEDSNTVDAIESRLSALTESRPSSHHLPRLMF